MGASAWLETHGGTCGVLGFSLFDVDFSVGRRKECSSFSSLDSCPMSCGCKWTPDGCQTEQIAHAMEAGERATQRAREEAEDEARRQMVLVVLVFLMVVMGWVIRNGLKQ